MNKKLKTSSAELHPIPVKAQIWCQVGMDMIGPLTETPRGNKYVIPLTDYFSKWAEATAHPDKTADGVARFMYSVSQFKMRNLALIYFYCLSRQYVGLELQKL